ncbi:DUF3168 domain-containing protein [Exiguobacterium oxidotolerans]|uniref:DUF3168 domain-containing protein n=1 Tax=Exiguobacterium oxidotolerans TaxID=223958 RepID=UPI000A072AE4|nr:DUF3168 domain-containing protein [Exiguobacterium oxidotolerans]
MNGILYELQVALLMRLKALVGVPVFDYVAKGTALPYVTIGEYTGVLFDAKDFDGLEPTVTLHAWSEAKGKAEAMKLLAKMEDALRDPLPLREGHSVIVQRPEFQTVLQEGTNITSYSGDVNTYHGVLRVRFKIIKGVI